MPYVSALYSLQCECLIDGLLSGKHCIPPRHELSRPGLAHVRYGCAPGTDTTDCAHGESCPWESDGECDLPPVGSRQPVRTPPPHFPGCMTRRHCASWIVRAFAGCTRLDLGVGSSRYFRQEHLTPRGAGGGCRASARPAPTRPTAAQRAGRRCRRTPLGEPSKCPAAHACTQTMRMGKHDLFDLMPSHD